MEIKLLNQDKENKKSVFVLKNSNPAIANTLRRTIANEVPVMAIDIVEFVKNSSALYDEMIAHRLGLVPLETDLKGYTIQKECTCKGKGCTKCQTTFKLSASGPCTVYSEELKFKDKAIKPAYDKMPIVKLLKGQKLELEGTAILGIGKEHSKFIPGLAYYKYYPEIIISDNKGDEKVVAVCPKNIFKVEGDKLKTQNETECILCGACEDESKNIKIKASDSDFIFYIDSWGQLKPKEIIIAALDILEKKLKEFDKELKKLK